MSTPELTRRAALDGRIARFDRMVEIREFEDRTKDLFGEGLVHGTTHTAQGQEAVAVGLASAILPTDTVTCTYRGHGIALSLGMTPETVLGEIVGRTIGSIGGVGGSMHLCDPEIGLLPTFAIVGAGLPVAAGAAYSAQVRGTDDIAVAVFGDGSTNIGAFHETMNIAAVWNLPLVFLCENNVYGEYSRYNLTTPVDDIAVRATSYNMRSLILDGQDVDVMASSLAAEVAKVRDGVGPVLVEAKTYRYAGHSRADTAPYRPEGEFDQWLERDPIDTFERRLVDEGVLDGGGAEALRAEVAQRIATAVETVFAAPEPGVDSMFTNVWAD